MQFNKELFKVFMFENGLTQRSVAQNLELTPAELSRKVNGQTKFSLSDYFNFRLAYKDIEDIGAIADRIFFGQDVAK